MAFIKDIKIEDNATPAAATSKIVAQRLGKTLRERFEDHIHKRECTPDMSDYDIKMASRAIAAFSIYSLASVDEIIAGKSVCDSSKDGGIDAICVNHNEKLVVIVQSKFNQAGNGTWTKDDFVAFKFACEKLQLEEYHRFDEILQSMSADIDTGLSSQDYKFLFVMAHTGKRGAAEAILSDMQTWQDELNSAALAPDTLSQDELPFQVHLVSAEDLTEWLQAGTHVSIDLDDVEIEDYGQKKEPYLSFYGQIGGDQILEWWESHGTRLFSRNIRNLLGDTEVNASIKETANSEPEMFWYYNNGITLLVSDIQPHRRNASRDTARGTFKFTNVSIINGAQTVSTIGQIFKGNTAERSTALSQIKISARFIKVNDTENAEIATAITKANNHQNRVLGRDFASQHPEQIRLSRELAVEGYQYQLLRTSGQPTPNEQTVIDLDEALDGLACLTGSSSILTTLKVKRGRFFESLDGNFYKTIFNPTVSGIKVINSVTHLRTIEKLISDKLENTDRAAKRKQHLIVTHANRVLTSILLREICGILNATEIILPNESKLLIKLEFLCEEIEQYIEAKYTNAYPARFFANIDKVEEIIRHLTGKLKSHPLSTTSVQSQCPPV
ncbi:AIPR family protein [Pseudomonas mosselii]|uniref:AIPR family protein n=1 Tax=Pseudomonas mosselii TaxID=78327 RepID=UPI002618B015|nr:AIPR family protein [Pseudomonas mosselii]MDN4496495.1 AIPR family protein [Pseudomonas mosselii]